VPEQDAQFHPNIIPFPFQGVYVSKLHLSLDDLDVQTFHTTPARSSGKGTVFGAAATDWWYNSCGVTYCDTCNATNPEVDCGGGDSADCPSVNVANCESVEYGCGVPNDRTTGWYPWSRDDDPNCT
jgi:hypothetical protein